MAAAAAAATTQQPSADNISAAAPTTTTAAAAAATTATTQQEAENTKDAPPGQHFVQTRNRSVVHTTAVIHDLARIGAGCILEQYVTIDCFKHAHVELRGSCLVRKHVTIKPGSVRIKSPIATTNNSSGTKATSTKSNSIADDRCQEARATIPVTIGEFVTIDPHATVTAASIGAFAYIGDYCSIHDRAILGDCCYIEPHSVVAAGTVVPAFCRFGGSPATFRGYVPYSAREEAMQRITDHKRWFLAKQNTQQR